MDRWLRAGVCLLLVASLDGAVRNKPKVRSRELRRVPEKIQKLLRSTPAIERGRIGFKFVDVESGVVLAEQNAGDLFTPASNAKLYTTAMALARLGAEYQFRTEVRTSSGWKPGETTVADLYLVGGGDPNLSGRPLPYRIDPTGSPEPDPLSALRQLADAVYDAGVRTILGDVVGYASRYPKDRYPDGWTLDDTLYGYGAPVSALTVNDNVVLLTLRPTELGGLADATLQPAPQHFIVSNQVSTDASSETHVLLSRAPGSNEVVLTGTIGQRVAQWKEELGLDDAAETAAEDLRDLLRERGVTILGEARSQYGGSAPMPPTVIVEKNSQPLALSLQVVNKVSQNQHAEMLLREVAFVRTGVGTLQAGVKEREAFLAEAGVTKDHTGYALDDGSGLARQDLTTPDSTVALLRFMWARPDRDVWVNTLPIGAVDGSLQHRFQRIAGAERLRAKTGSLSHVNALSGYIETRTHRNLAFSAMVNGTSAREKDVRDFLDRLCALFLDL